MVQVGGTNPASATTRAHFGVGTHMESRAKRCHWRNSRHQFDSSLDQREKTIEDTTYALQDIVSKRKLLEDDKEDGKSCTIEYMTCKKNFCDEEW